MLITQLVKKEITENLYSYRFILSLVICVVMTLFILLVLSHEQMQAFQDYNNHLIAEEDRVTEYRGYTDYMYQGTSVFREPNSLSVFHRGLYMDWPLEVQINMVSEPFITEKKSQKFLAFIFGKFDYGFFISIILSLIAVMFSYDSVTREKERGTLKLIFTNQVSRVQFILGKWLGGFISLCIPFFASFLVAVMVMMLYPEIKVIAYLPELLTLAMIYLLFLAVLFSLGMVVSSSVARSGTSINILLLVWVLLVLVIPSFGPYFSVYLKQASYTKLTREKNEINEKFVKQHWGRRWKIYQQKDKTEEEKQSEWALLLVDLNQKRNKKIAKIEDKFFKELDEQIKVSRYLTYVSPRSLFEVAATEVCQTGITDLRRFYRHFNEYRRDFLEHGFKTVAEMKGNMWRDFSAGEYPRFAYSKQSILETVRYVLVPEVMALLVMLLLLMIIMVIMFYRYDIR